MNQELNGVPSWLKARIERLDARVDELMHHVVELQTDLAVMRARYESRAPLLFGVFQALVTIATLVVVGWLGLKK